MSQPQDQTPSATSSGTNPVVWLGGVAAALAAILGFLFLLVPNLKPEPTPQVLGGTFSDIVWQQPYDGDLHFAVTAQINGFKNRPCPVGYAVYDTSGHYAGIGEKDAVELQPERDSDTGGITVSVPAPTAPGTYHVNFVLFAPNGSELDAKASQDFTVP